MWVFTNFGFFSATLRKDKSPTQLAAEGDNRILQIRARHVKHLENLRAVMGDQLGPTIEIKNRDYQCRAYATPEAWGRALTAITMGIDYDNFKNSVKDHELHTAAHKVWDAMAAVYGTGYTNSWTNYRNVKRPIKANHPFVPGEGNQKEWCQHGTTKCYYFADEHPAPARTSPKKSAPKSPATRAPNGRFLPKSEQLALTATTTDGFRWSADDSLEVLENDNAGDQDPTFMSLGKAASKVGCPTKQLRDWMTSKKEWADYRDGNAWFIPTDLIEQLDFQYWAEAGR